MMDTLTGIMNNSDWECLICFMFIFCIPKIGFIVLDLSKITVYIYVYICLYQNYYGAEIDANPIYVRALNFTHWDGLFIRLHLMVVI